MYCWCVWVQILVAGLVEFTVITIITIPPTPPFPLFTALITVITLTTPLSSCRGAGFSGECSGGVGSDGVVGGGGRATPPQPALHPWSRYDAPHGLGGTRRQYLVSVNSLSMDMLNVMMDACMVAVLGMTYWSSIAISSGWSEDGMTQNECTVWNS